MASMYDTRTVSPRNRRLTPGPSGLPRGQVTEIQRSRMLAAASEAVAEVGYAGMTIAQVIGRARVSRKTFYDVFADREDCFLAAFEQAISRAQLVAIEAYEQEPHWRDSIRASLAALLTFLDEHPDLACLCVVEALAAGDAVLERRAQVLDELASIVDRGRLERNAARTPAPLTAEGVVGGIIAVLHTRLIEDCSEPLSDLLGALMGMIVLPYLGARAASGELDRPLPERRRVRRTRTSVRSKDPLDDLNMRLTYRTVRVLSVIGEQPGASNRQIAEDSGIIDQGQISKLLNRLARLTLVENLGEGQERGAANAWHLTARGAQVERATHPR
jgi:AcrR family transcriptional regulator/DNA-binding MarR family transcriptional regulator